MQAVLNWPLQSTRARAFCRRGVPYRCIQGKTLYMFVQFEVAGKLYVEVIMTKAMAKRQNGLRHQV